MAKRATPEKGIKYTFKFKKQDKTHFTTLLFEGMNDKGRYEFYNYQSKAYTSMPPLRFSYIHRFNLVREERVKMEIKEVPAHLIIDNPIFENLNDQQKETLNKLRGLSPLQKNLIKAAIGRSVEELANDLELYFSSPAEEERLGKKGLWGEWNKAQTALLTAIKAN